VAVDVYGSFAGPRGIVTASPGIVANKRNNDTGIASLVLDVLHVGTIGEVILQAAAGTTVFILGLEEDDRSSIGNLGLGDGCAYIFHVARRNVSEFLKLISTKRNLLVCRLQVRLITSTQNSIHTLQPAGETTTR
jgi:hypothetical protein